MKIFGQFYTWYRAADSKWIFKIQVTKIYQNTKFTQRKYPENTRQYKKNLKF